MFFVKRNFKKLQKIANSIFLDMFAFIVFVSCSQRFGLTYRTIVILDWLVLK